MLLLGGVLVLAPSTLKSRRVIMNICIEDDASLHIQMRSRFPYYILYVRACVLTYIYIYI